MKMKFIGAVAVTILLATAGCKNQPQQTKESDATIESVSYAEPVKNSDALAFIHVEKAVPSDALDSFLVSFYIAKHPSPSTLYVGCLKTRSDCKLLKVGGIYYVAPVSDDDPTAYSKQLTSKLRVAGNLRLYCQGGSIIYFVVDAKSGS